MKNVCIIAAFAVCLMLPVVCMASPFIVCDPQTGVTHYKVTGAPWVSSPVPAQADGSIKMDISTAPVGTSNLSFVACRTQEPWGEVCSTATPFSFTRPASPQIPVNFRLEK